MMGGNRVEKYIITYRLKGFNVKVLRRQSKTDIMNFLKRLSESSEIVVFLNVNLN